MEDDNRYELFGEETTKEVLTAFQKLYTIGIDNQMGKLTDLQKEVLTGVASGMSYSKLQSLLDKKHIASIQAPLSGSIKNLLDAVVDTVWLYNNLGVQEWLDVHAGKRYPTD